MGLPFCDEAGFFNYGSEQTGWLCECDPILASAIQRIGSIRRSIHPDAFQALLWAVAGQQISAGAQASIWARFTAKFGVPEPERLAAADPIALRECGLSLKKCGYIIGIARAFAEGRFSHAGLASMADKELAEALRVLPGVGAWTAEMLLIFTFQRPDVLSYGDLAIKRGICRLYGCTGLSKPFFERLRKRYSPYATVASLYLWQVAGENPQNGE